MNRIQKAVAGSVLGLSILGTVVGGVAAADPDPQATITRPGFSRAAWGGGAGMAEGRGFGFQAMEEPLTNLLGLSHDEIQAKREAGQSLAQIAAEKGISEQQLVDTLLAVRKAGLDARVQSGAITQAQADAAYAQMQTRVKESVQRTEVGPNGPADGERHGLGWGRGTDPVDQGASGTGLGPRWAR